jgi:S-disulfanyl-L-cysteine oxidoreductase SoxD
MDKPFAMAIAISLVFEAPCLAAQGLDFGQTVTSADEIAAWDISILSDGTGLPAGSGTAKRGEAIYARQCVACHGEKGTGNPAEPPSPVSAGPLTGGQGTLAGDQVPIQTVGSYWPYATTLFDYIRRAMPWSAPKSLIDEDVYSLTAYILHLNGIISESDVINAQTLSKVRMPNRDNFIRIYPREP